MSRLELAANFTQQSCSVAQSTVTTGEGAVVPADITTRVVVMLTVMFAIGAAFRALKVSSWEERGIVLRAAAAAATGDDAATPLTVVAVVALVDVVVAVMNAVRGSAADLLLARERRGTLGGAAAHMGASRE